MKFMFSHIIRKYELELKVVRHPDSQLVDGRVQEGTPIEFYLDMIILPANAEEIEEEESGGYTTQWKSIIVRDGQDYSLEKNDIVFDTEGERYEIRERTSWKDYADFTSWLAKKVVVE